MLPGVEALDLDQVSAVLQLIAWFGEQPSFPERVRLEARREWLAFRAPLDRLAARPFVGRRSVLESLVSFIEDERGTAYSLSGIGGSGKSTILSRLLLNLPSTGVPFAYINYDRGWLIDEGPLAVFDEILRQLAMQLPHERAQLLHLRDRSRLLARGMAGWHDVASRAVQRQSEVNFGVFEELGLILGSDRRLVIALDTLEELLRRDDAYVIETLRFLAAMSDVVPGLRAVLAGRGRPLEALD
nr:AAA family ATPase [Micromonospora sp. DSM 115978]